MANARHRGSTQTEYVLIAAIVSVAILGGVLALGGSLTDIFTGIADIFSGF
jgi:Flp pilus assembly pilin Flp